jgi:hypothetical protein
MAIYRLSIFLLSFLVNLTFTKLSRVDPRCHSPLSTPYVINRTTRTIMTSQTTEEDDSTNNNSQQQMIQCLFCKIPTTIETLGEHINDNPETKREAIKEQLQLWAKAYDREYLIINLVFCPSFDRISHWGDWLGG